MKNYYKQNQSTKKNSFFPSTWKLLLLMLLLWTSNSFAQLLSENFESGFPVGWTTTNNTGFPWFLATNASGYGAGNNSVYIDFYNMSSGSEQLNTVQFAASASGYMLVFDEAYATYSTGYDDQLQINYSTDGGATFNLLVLLDGGQSGILNTGGLDANPWVPSANQWQTFAFALPVGTNMIQFNGITGFGNNLYLDNVQVTQACAGTPAAGSATSLTSSTCPFANFTVSLSGADNTPGLTYQWQSSADNIIFNDITGATNRNLVTNEINNSWYQCVITCTNSGLTATSVSLEMPVNVSALPLLQDFEGISFPDQCFSESFNTAYPWSHSGAASGYGVGTYSAKMDFWDLPSGSEQLYTSQFDPITAGYVLRFDEAYATAFNSDDQLQVLISSDGGITFTQLDLLNGGDAGPLNTGGDLTGGPFVPSAGQWQTFSYNLPLGTNMVQFNAITAYGNNLYLDNVHIFVPIPCSGTPVAGTTVSFSNPVGQNVQFLLGLTGTDNTDGLTFQWQSSPDNIVWTNIIGATLKSLTTSGTADTWYQCVVTCTNSGMSANSVPVFEQEHLAFTWTPVATLAPAINEGTNVLLTDGTVFCKSIAGGTQGLGNIWDKLTPDIHGSYVNGTWTTTAPMISERLFFSSQVLKDGRVYVAGGEYSTQGVQDGSKAETYDPINDVWTAAAELGLVISDANSEILDNGMVLQDYPYYNVSALYDPTTNTTTQLPNTLGNSNEAAWVKLPDNSILYANTLSVQTERFIPSTNQWIADASTIENLYDPYGAETGPAFLLPNGKAIFFGSEGNTEVYTPSGSTAPGTLEVGPPIPNDHGMPDASAAMMVNGRILIACQKSPHSGGDLFAAPTTFYEFDYTSNTYTQVNAPFGGNELPLGSYQTIMLDLPDGTVLFVTQQDASSSQYFVYSPSGSQIDAGKPAISTVTPINCYNYRITGTGFNGISEGAAFGDDAQMETNYPVFRLTSGTNVYYTRSYNWNSTGVQRGSAPDTVYFTTPAGIPAGWYYLTATANGVKSDSVSVYIGLPAEPGSITGNATPCYNSNQTYSIDTAMGANSYVWSIPGNWSGSSTTTSINTSSLNGNGNITVAAVNICGSSPVQTLPITIMYSPLEPGIITGPASACAGSIQTYTIAPDAGATSYLWLIPSGWSGSSTTTSITVTIGAGGGNVIVHGVNACGPGSGRSLLVTALHVPNTPGTITGPVNVCSGSVHTYTIASVANATSYIWSIPAGWTGTSTSTSITVTVGTGSGNMVVLAVNSCGISTSARTLAVSSAVGVGQPGPISGNFNVCQGTQQIYHIVPVSGASSYTWTLPNGWTGSSASVSITTTAGASSGNITVTANNSCGSSAPSILAVSVGTLLSTPGPISGSTSVCQGSSQTYSVSPVPGATSYLWTIPTGWGGTSTSNSITCLPNAFGGNVTVRAVNACSTSPVRTLAVTSHSVTQVIITGNPGNFNFCAQTSPTNEKLMATYGYTSYSWSPSGGNSQTATVSAVNTYTVTATNAAGCTTTASKAVTNNCALPTSLTTTNILGTSAKANWMISECAVNYTVRISVHGMNTWTNYTVTLNSKSFTGLSLSTSYDWQIMTNCNTSGTINSGWSATQTFTTLAQRLTEEGSAFNIYPNPADALVTVAFSSLEEGVYKLSMIDMMGRVVKSEIINAGLGDNTCQMNLDGIAKGVYMVMLQHGDNISKAKLVVE